MIAQLCNSHGFFHGWLATQYHHEVFRAIVTQIEEHYTGNCIVVDDTWLPRIANEETFVTMYPNVMREDVEHIFFVNLVDPSSSQAPREKSQEIIQQLTTAKHKHNINPTNFQFWAYFCQQEFYKTYANKNLAWAGDKLFLSYNRKPASHREELCRALHSNSLTNAGIITLGNNDPTKAITIRENTKSEDIDGNVGVPNDIRSLGSHQIWQKSFINIVTETVTHGSFLSEKIWKPIIGKRPFMLVGPPGSLRKLRELGFKTFEEFWDESYNDLVINSVRRVNQLDEIRSIEKICELLVELNEFPSTTHQLLYEQMLPILEHNHKHFFETFTMENRARIDTIVQDEMNG